MRARGREAGLPPLAGEMPKAKGADHFTYDPRDPVMSLMHQNSQSIPVDQSPNDHRQDILVYQTDPLTEDLDVIGPITLKLWASTDALETDFTAKLAIVHEDGLCINLTYGIIRTSNPPLFPSPLGREGQDEGAGAVQCAADAHPSAPFASGVRGRERAERCERGMPAADEEPATQPPTPNTPLLYNIKLNPIGCRFQSRTTHPPIHLLLRLPELRPKPQHRKTLPLRHRTPHRQPNHLPHNPHAIPHPPANHPVNQPSLDGTFAKRQGFPRQKDRKPRGKCPKDKGGHR